MAGSNLRTPLRRLKTSSFCCNEYCSHLWPTFISVGCRWLDPSLKAFSQSLLVDSFGQYSLPHRHQHSLAGPFWFKLKCLCNFYILGDMSKNLVKSLKVQKKSKKVVRCQLSQKIDRADQLESKLSQLDPEHSK